MATQQQSQLDMELLSCFYEGISDPRRFAQGLQRMAEALVCERVSLRIWDRRGYWGYRAQAALEAKRWSLTIEDSDHAEPLPGHLASRLESGRWVNLSPLSDEPQPADWLSRARNFCTEGESVLAILLPLSQADALLSLHRQSSDWPQTSSTLALATQACGALLPALEPIVRLRQLSRRCEQVTAMLNSIRLPILLLDASVRPLAANHAARKIFRLPAPASSGKFSAALPGVPASQLSQLVERACAMKPEGGAMEFALHQGAVAAQLLVLPMASSAMGNGQAAALAIVQQAEDTPEQAQHLLQLAYRLTPAEARMAQLILDGHSPGQIAAILKLSIATVRTQLSSVLRKTGTQRQADLVRHLSPLLFLKSPAIH